MTFEEFMADGADYGSDWTFPGPGEKRVTLTLEGGEWVSGDQRLGADFDGAARALHQHFWVGPLEAFRASRREASLAEIAAATSGGDYGVSLADVLTDLAGAKRGWLYVLGGWQVSIVERGGGFEWAVFKEPAFEATLEAAEAELFDCFGEGVR